MSSHLKAELAATCSTLGRFHKGEYLIEPECIESIKDLIRYLKRDDEAHEIRRYLGECKVLQNDLIHIAKSCPEDMPELFDVTLRLLINLTTPTMIFYGEEMPAEKIGRNIYLSLIGYNQDYKVAFCDVEFWNKICGKLTNYFELDWTDRSADHGIQIERILMLLRNVLHIPADVESEKRPENDVTIHDKVLWALRHSQILELLLFVAANENEEQYYLNLLEIFSLILREQNPKWLALCDVHGSAEEKNKETDELARVREIEKRNQNKYLNMRNFNATYVMKGVKSLSNNDVICHKSLDKVTDINVNHSKKQMRVRKNKIPVESERKERRSTFTVRLFLKEFCLEFLNNGFGNLMSVVKNRLDSGKSLAHDQTYYFWALKFFLDFTVASNLDVNLIKNCLSMESFHFVQTSMDYAFEHLLAEKKKTVDWVKRIHLILKAYHSLLETLLWMDCSKNPLIRSISREIKSELFYVVEYREMTLHVLLRYDPSKFSISYLRDLIETTHLFIKLLEEYSKQTKLVVQKVARKRSSKKKTKKEVVETKEEKWEKIKDDVYDILSSENLFPEIPPFDAALDIPIDDQKGRAMKNIQNLLHKGEMREAIGLLRSSRQVWPENDHFGTEGMSVEEETMALQEICLADLDGLDEKPEDNIYDGEEDNEEEEEEEEQVHVVEQDFDIMDYKKRLVNKKVVEGCGVLLKNYKKNSVHTNHCVIKLLHRIGWECCMPAMLYQASLFWTLLQIINDKSGKYSEINTFTLNLVRKFRKDASKNPVIFLELLFWKENNVALEIQHGYQPYEDKEKPKKRSRKKKGKIELSGDELPIEGEVKKRGRRKKSTPLDGLESVEGTEESGKGTHKRIKKKMVGEKIGVRKRNLKKRTEERADLLENSKQLSEPELLEDGSGRDVDDWSKLVSDLSENESSVGDETDNSLTPAEESSGIKGDLIEDSWEVMTRKYKKRAGLLDDSGNEEESERKSKSVGESDGERSAQKGGKSDHIFDDSKKAKKNSKNRVGTRKNKSKPGKNNLEFVVLNDSGEDEQNCEFLDDGEMENFVGDTITKKYKKRLTVLEDSDDESESFKNSHNENLEITKVVDDSIHKLEKKENFESGKSFRENKKKFGRNALKSRVLTDNSEDEQIGESLDATEMKNGGVADATAKKYKKSAMLVGDSENEDECFSNNKKTNVRESVKESKDETVKPAENILGKDSDCSNDSSQLSDLSKKRGRKGSSKSNNHREDFSDDSDNSKSKRRRFIASDSDMGNYDTDEEGPVSSRKNKKRAAILDSDSDLEAHNSADDK